MDRSSSPLHLHIGRNAPVHVHVSPKKKMTTSQRLAKSFAEMSAGRPSLRATEHLRSSGPRMRAQQFVESSTHQGPWVPPPGKSTRNTMTWKSPSHLLEITPAVEDGDTVLTVEDLGSSGSGSARIVVENGGKQKLRKEVKSLTNEVNSLRAEADLDRSLHEEELREKQEELNHSRRSLRQKEVEVLGLKEQLEESQVDKLKLRGALSALKEDADSSIHATHQLESQRELLMKKLVEAEMDGTAMTQQVETLKRTLRKMEREKYSTVMQMSELSKHKDLLLDKLAEFDSTNQSLRKMLRSQQNFESNLEQLSVQKDLLLSKLSEADRNNHKLRQQLVAKEAQAAEKEHLKGSLLAKEMECETMTVKVQALEGQLRQTNEEFTDLQASVDELQRQSIRDRESLKRMTKQQREESSQHQDAVDKMTGRLEETHSELGHMQTRNSKLLKEKARLEAEVGALSAKIREMENMSREARETSKLSLEAVNARLVEKTRELNVVGIENERLKASLACAEEKLQSAEVSSQSQHSELDQMQTRNSKLLKEKARLEAEVGALSAKISEMDSMSREARETSKLSMEAVNARLVEKTRELNVVGIENEKLKASLACAEEKLQSAEVSSQSQTAALKAEVSQLRASVAQYESLTAEYRSQTDKLHNECSEVRRQLQHQEQETERVKQEGFIETERVRIKLQQQLTGLGPVEEALKTAEVQLKDAKERLLEQDDRIAEQTKLIAEFTLKERTNLGRVADLESQLSRANLSISQMRKTKEDAERRHSSRMTEMKLRCEQAENAHKSLQSYVSLLKSSYVNMFSDLSGSPSKYTS